MTPEEKAKELIEKFMPETYFKANRTQAVAIAIICVEEIIKLMDSDSFYAVTINDEEKFVPVEDYWNEVLNYLKSKQ